MKCRSLFTLTGLGLLGSAGLAAYFSGKPVGEGSTSTPKLETLRAHVPTTLAFMAPMASFGTFDRFSGLVGKTDVQNWVSIDMMKSLVAGGETDLVTTPSYAAANLFNKGPLVRLVAMIVWGMLYTLGPGGSSVQGIEGLKGRGVGVPLPDNMPDLVLCYLMTQGGIPLEGGTEGIEIAFYDQAPELVKALMSGQVGCAVLPEYVAIVVQNQVKQSGKNLDRIADLQEVWARATDGQARFPMVDVMMPQKFVDSNQAFVAGVLSELEEAVAKIDAPDGKAVTAIIVKIEVPRAMTKSMTLQLQFEMVSAQRARVEPEDFYAHLATLSPDIVGGKTLVDDFYLADPR